MLCIQDSYATSVRTQVRSCLREGDGWAVILADELLYPEGGGQPSDHGTIDGMPVTTLRKTRDGVVHTIAGPVEGEVEVVLDRVRRFDHMQQHSGQHLLSAIAQDRFGLPTTAFHLGPDRADIEVDGGVDPARLRHLEDAVNTAIREARPLRVREVLFDELDRLPVRTRGLPDGFSGHVRLVEIDGIDLNTCGGTHVRDTAELQVLQIIAVEPLKRGTRLHFLVGDRVRAALRDALGREVALTRRLSCPPADHAAAVERLWEDGKQASKAQRLLLAELGAVYGGTLEPTAGRVRFHHADGDLGLLGAVAHGVLARFPDARFVGTAGEREGVFLLAGPEAWVAEEGPLLAQLLEGKGGGAKGRYQGRGTRLDRRPA